MKWKKLEHNGILFPPDFETKKIKIKIKGESVDLDINQEDYILDHNLISSFCKKAL